jgi:LuxR family transcriptional regulator, maltose regulon positive regulatory protein
LLLPHSGIIPIVGWNLLAGNPEPLHLRRTKLYRPRAAGDLIHRPRVCEILNRHLDRAVTSVCAPAGFGKTTLLVDWLEGCPSPSAWLSLDEGDSDLCIFVTYFVAAIRTLFPSACAETLALLQAPAAPTLSPVLTALVNDLDRLADDAASPAERALATGERFILVLDDYHLVREPAIHALLSELLRHPPRSMHLVVSARQDPPFPLHTLRARRELGEIRMQELRFTPEETAAFMEQALGAPLDQGPLATLVERTEGWATGLRLAALSLSTGGNVAHPGSELMVDNRFVLDYLMKEVLTRVPLATQDFLLKTSILDRMCGPLCDTVVGSAGSTWDGRAYLEWLAAENLFTFSLDAQGTWYRYHHLFQALLRSHLERQHSAEEIAELRARAGAWFAQNGLIEEAIEHALAAGDEMAAVQLVEAYRHKAMNQERWRQLERLLNLMPRRLIDARPELLVLEAWTLHGRFCLSDLPACLDRATMAIEQTPLPEPAKTSLRGEVDTLRSQLLYWVADPARALEVAQRALSTVGPECIYVRATAMTYHAGALQMQGNLKGALDAILDALREDRAHGGVAQARLLMILCALYLVEADALNLAQTANLLIKVARDDGLLDSLTRANFYLGCAYYAQDDLAAAEKCFAFVVERRHTAYGLIAAQGGFGLASVRQAQGLADQARATLALIVDYATTMNNSAILRDAEAYGAHLALLQGRQADADRWAARVDRSIRAAPMPLFFVASFSLVEVLLSQGTPASLGEASQRLARLQSIVQATHNTRFLIEVLALQALALEARGDRATALKTLEQAVALAKPGGVIRFFVDLGPRIAALLRQLSALRIGAAESAPADYLPRLLAAFGDVKEFQALPAEAAQVEPLSEREVEVLALLSERMTNKEIARELSISPMTVKRHTVNIYQKLSVSGRRDAVAAAFALGLLPSSQPARRRFASF